MLELYILEWTYLCLEDERPYWHLQHWLTLGCGAEELQLEVVLVAEF
jgi:hypothetical protein